MPYHLYFSIYIRLLPDTPTSAVLSSILNDLDDGTNNPINDEIFECIFKYILTGSSEYLSRARSICSQQISQA